MSGGSSIISGILSVLTIIGVLGVIVAIALIGFNMILGSASEKAVSQEKFVGIFIAAVLLVAGTMIAKYIISIASTI